MKKYIKPSATAFQLTPGGMLAVSKPTLTTHPDTDGTITDENEFLSGEKEAPFGSFEWQE